MEQSEYYPVFRNCTLALILLDNYGKFAIISCLLTLRVTSCHCVLVSCKATQWRETFPKHKNVAMKPHCKAFSPCGPASRFFLISWSPTAEVGAWWCPFNWSSLCSQIWCTATWQLQYPLQKSISFALRSSLVNTPLKICHANSPKMHIDMYRYIYRYIGIHIKKPLELWMQFILGDSTFLSVWTLRRVGSCLLLLWFISLMILLSPHESYLATLSW